MQNTQNKEKTFRISLLLKTAKISAFEAMIIRHCFVTLQKFDRTNHGKNSHNTDKQLFQLNKKSNTDSYNLGISLAFTPVKPQHMEEHMKKNNNGTALNFEQDGVGPAIIFIHDGTDNTSISDQRFAALVKAGFRIILTNLRGLTECGKATVDDLTDDAVALLNHLGIGRAVIFGIGGGGCVLLNLLEKHPERIVGSSLVIPSAMAESLHRFTDRKGLLKTLRNASAEPLSREVFATASAAPTPPLSEIPALCAWLDQIAKRPCRGEESGLALLAGLKLPLLLIDSPTSPTGRRWRQRLGGRLRAFNGSLLALIDLLVPAEEEEFDEEVLNESH